MKKSLILPPLLAVAASILILSCKGRQPAEGNAPAKSGETSITFQLCGEDPSRIPSESLWNAQLVLRNRLDRMGLLSEATVIPVCDSGRIYVTIPSAVDPERIMRLVAASGKLEFYETHPGSIVVEALEGTYASIPLHLIDYDSADSSPDPIIGYALPEDTLKVGQRLRDLQMSGKCDWPENLRFRWERECNSQSLRMVSSVDPSRDYLGLIAVRTDEKGQAAMDGRNITNAQAEVLGHNEDGSDIYVVNLYFNSEGTRLWWNLTERNIGRHIAIVLDDRVYSYPLVNEAISGGACYISGDLSQEEAEDLASILLSGTLPDFLEIVEAKINQ